MSNGVMSGGAVAISISFTWHC